MAEPSEPRSFDPTQHWFESIWADREEKIYPALFGDIGTTIHTIPAKLFSLLGHPETDPRWLTHGVFECPPNADRADYIYITSGMSNPWGETPDNANADGPSGLGFEFYFQTKSQSPWAISTLQWLMAIQILVATGAIRGALLEYFDRVPLHASIDPRTPESKIRNLIVAQPAVYPHQFSLASGKVDLMLCVGISDQEREFGRTQGGPELVELLTHHLVFPYTDPARKSVI